MVYYYVMSICLLLVLKFISNMGFVAYDAFAVYGDARNF